MDWVSNRTHNIALTYNYWPLERWVKTWAEMGLSVKELRERLKLYPIWARPFFESHLHFMVLLNPS
jgi:hypothetical protein